MPRRNNDSDSPVMPIEYPVDSDPIWPCQECQPWHIDIVREPQADGSDLLMVREWHAVSCPTYQALL